MMAAALGPPEVIAQLENAAKVLMVRTPGLGNRGISGTPVGSPGSDLPSPGLVARKGLGMNPEVEVVVAWRRIPHPTFLCLGPLLSSAVSFPDRLAPQPGIEV